MLKVIPIVLLSGFLLLNTRSVLADTNHPLFEAIERGQIERVRTLLARNRLGINAREILGETPLSRAVEAQNPELVRVLLAAGANPNQIVDVGSTVFDLALNKESVDIIGQLIDAGANLEPQHEYDESPLQTIIHRKDLVLARKMVEKGAPIQSVAGATAPIDAAAATGVYDLFAYFASLGAKPRHPSSLAEAAALGGNTRIYRLALEQQPNAIATTDSLYYLIQAALRGKQAAIYLELLHSKLANGLTSQQLTYLLHQAAVYGRLDAVNRLIEMGADIHAPMPDPRQVKGYRSEDDVYSDWTIGRHLLTSAIYGNNPALVQSLLDRGLSPKLTDKEKIPVLLSSWRNPDITRALLGAGADIHAIDTQGETILQKECYNDGIEFTRWLIERGADVNHQNAEGETLLMCAASQGNLELVDLLLKAGAKPGLVDKRGNFALNRAVGSHHYSSGRNKDVIELLVRKGADINQRSAAGENVLFDTYDEMTPELAQLLLKLGATPPNTDLAKASFIKGLRDRSNGELLYYWAHKLELSSKDQLQMAILSKQPEAVRQLIAQGTELSAIDTDGNSTLMSAAASPEILALLLDQPHAIHHVNRKGQTALMLAAQAGQAESVRRLLKHGAKIDAGDQNGKTALMYAAESGWPESVLVLIKAGTKLNARSHETEDSDYEFMRWFHQSDALMWAIEGGNLETVDMLLRLGLNINRQNAAGSTPLMLAAERGMPEMTRFLLARGADPRLTDIDDQTARDIADEGAENCADQINLHDEAMQILEQAMGPS